MAFKSRLPEIAIELEVRLHEVAASAAEMIAESARERVPVASGRLRDAIHVEKTETGASVVAGDREAFYGHIIEHGSRNAPAHPFLIPAAEAVHPELLSLAREALAKL